MTGDSIIYKPMSRSDYAKLCKDEAERILGAGGRKAGRLGVTVRTA